MESPTFFHHIKTAHCEHLSGDLLNSFLENFGLFLALNTCADVMMQKRFDTSMTPGWCMIIVFNVYLMCSVDERTPTHAQYVRMHQHRKHATQLWHLAARPISSSHESVRSFHHHVWTLLCQSLHLKPAGVMIIWSVLTTWIILSNHIEWGLICISIVLQGGEPLFSSRWLWRWRWVCRWLSKWRSSHDVADRFQGG